MRELLSLALLASASFSSATGPQTPLSDNSDGTRPLLLLLLQQVASSRPAAADPAFDCAWRRFALEYAPHTLPALSAAQHRQLYDALELGTICNVSSADTLPFDAAGSGSSGSGSGSRSGSSGSGSEHRHRHRHGDRGVAAAAGVTLYADSEHGSDETGDGSLQKPFASLHVAVAASRRVAAQQQQQRADGGFPQPQPQPRAVELRAGTYRLTETLILTEEDSGLTIASFPNEEAVISGNAVLSGIHVLVEPFK